MFEEKVFLKYLNEFNCTLLNESLCDIFFRKDMHNDKIYNNTIVTYQMIILDILW